MGVFQSVFENIELDTLIINILFILKPEFGIRKES